MPSGRVLQDLYPLRDGLSERDACRPIGGSSDILVDVELGQAGGKISAVTRSARVGASLPVEGEGHLRPRLRAGARNESSLPGSKGVGGQIGFRDGRSEYFAPASRAEYISLYRRNILKNIRLDKPAAGIRASLVRFVTDFDSSCSNDEVPGQLINSLISVSRNNSRSDDMHGLKLNRYFNSMCDGLGSTGHEGESKTQQCLAPLNPYPANPSNNELFSSVTLGSPCREASIRCNMYAACDTDVYVSRSQFGFSDVPSVAVHCGKQRRL